MAYGGEDMEMMGEFDHPIERYARVEEDAKLAETTFREINEDYIPYPEIPVTNDVDLPPNWVATDVEESGGPQTQIAVEDFKAYMRTTGKLSREPSKNLNFRYNSRTKDLEVQYPNKSGKLEWWRLTTDSNKNKFYAPSKYPKGLQVELGLLSAKPPELTAKQRQPLEVAKERIIASRSDNIDQDANVAVNALNEAVQSIGTNTDGIPMRELEAFDKGAQRTRGALADEVAKINEVKDHIATRKQKINRPDIDEATREVEVRELQKLEDELTARLEVASGHRETLRGQINRICETIDRVLNTDTTLAERIKTLFREQGVTIASLLTALGFIISTIVLSITHSVGAIIPNPPAPIPPAPKPTPPEPTPPEPTPPEPQPSGVKEWFKKQLQKLGEWLKALAGKAAAALPGIIGSAVSWLLKTAGGVAVWLAKHLWAIVVALVAAALIAVKELIH